MLAAALGSPEGEDREEIEGYGEEYLKCCYVYLSLLLALIRRPDTG